MFTEIENLFSLVVAQVRRPSEQDFQTNITRLICRVPYVEPDELEESTMISPWEMFRSQSLLGLGGLLESS